MSKKDVGRPRVFESPDELWQHFENYKIARLADTHWQRSHLAQKSGTLVKETVVPNLSRRSFDNYLYSNGIAYGIKHYIENKDGLYDEFLPTITRILSEIDDNMETGAVLGFHNPKVAAHLLGHHKEEQQAGGVTIQIVGLPDKDNNNLIDKI